MLNNLQVSVSTLIRELGASALARKLWIHPEFLLSYADGIADQETVFLVEQRIAEWASERHSAREMLAKGPKFRE